MREVLLIGVGGGLWALSQYGISRAMIHMAGETFPSGTLVVNSVGSLLIGLLMQRLLISDVMSSYLRLALIVVFLGAFNTFSAFGYETMHHLRNGGWHLGVINIIANVGLSLCFVLAGMAIARLVFKVPRIVLVLLYYVLLLKAQQSGVYSPQYRGKHKPMLKQLTLI